MLAQSTKAYVQLTTCSTIKFYPIVIVMTNEKTLLNTLYSHAVNHLPGSHLSLSGQCFSRCILSSSCAKKAEAILGFHFHLSPLVVPFGRRRLGIQTLLYLLSFLLHQMVLWAQSFPGCPGLLWLRHVHHAQVPQGNPACHAYRGYHLSLVVHRNTLKEAVKETVMRIFKYDLVNFSRKLFVFESVIFIVLNLISFVSKALGN